MFRFVLITLFVLIIMACAKDKAMEVKPEDCVEIISYSESIEPLIQQSCATNLGPGTGCHDNWIFEYENVRNSVQSGAFGNVIETSYMPTIPNNFNIEPLTNKEIETFLCWIKQGALNN